MALPIRYYHSTYAKWKAFGWNVMEMEGNQMQATLDGLAQAKAAAFKGVPTVILMHTEMGYGVDFMMGSHGVAWNSA